jgi:hypothetical protein
LSFGLVKRMLSVVHSSDCPKLEFIQPHPLFVAGDKNGCLRAATKRCGVRLVCGEMIPPRESDTAARPPYL